MPGKIFLVSPISLSPVTVGIITDVIYGYGVTKETKLNDTQLLQQYLATSSQEPPCDILLYNDLEKMCFLFLNY